MAYRYCSYRVYFYIDSNECQVNLTLFLRFIRGDYLRNERSRR
jgi:hypothetical protein